MSRVLSDEGSSFYYSYNDGGTLIRRVYYKGNERFVQNNVYTNQESTDSSRMLSTTYVDCPNVLNTIDVYGEYSEESQNLKIVENVDLKDNGTLVFWVKPNSKQPGINRYIFSAIKTNLSGSNTSVLNAYFDQDYKLHISRNLNTTGFTCDQYLTPDTWQLVAIKWENGKISARINNNPFYVYFSSSFDLSTHSLMMGASITYNSNKLVGILNGVLGMFAYSNQALTEVDVEKFYHENSITEITKHFDGDNRISSKDIVTLDGKLESSYHYFDEDGKLNPYVCKEVLVDGTSIVYSYDEMGNITHKVSISKEGVILEALGYQYDGLNRLIEERRFRDNNVFDYCTRYEYDNNGNKRKESRINQLGECVQEVTYEYDSSIPDQLIRVLEDGQVIETLTYTKNGQVSLNPQTWKVLNQEKSLKWEGRRLREYGTCKYTYNSEGIRVSKEANGSNYHYTLEGNKIIELVKTTGSTSKRLRFRYDESDILVGLNLNQNEYYYVRDITGNILKVVDKQGTTMINYSYDAWGKPNSSIPLTLIGETKLVAEELLELNPFLFKGYYYDVETGLYWVSSRYYVPEWGRWLSADDVSYLDPESINGLNLYAYCLNNPVMYIDPTGKFPLMGTIIGGILGGLIGMATAALNGQNIWYGALIGATAGALIGLAVDTLGGSTMLSTTFGIGFGADVLSQVVLEEKNILDVNLIQAGYSGLLSMGMAGVGKGINFITSDFSKGIAIFSSTVMNAQVNLLGYVGGVFNSKMIANNFSLTPRQIYNEFIVPNFKKVKRVIEQVLIARYDT